MVLEAKMSKSMVLASSEHLVKTFFVDSYHGRRHHMARQSKHARELDENLKGGQVS